MRLNREIIPVKWCQGCGVGKHAEMDGPNAQALSFRNSGDVGGFTFMLK